MQKLVWQNADGVEIDLTSGNYGITEWEGFSGTGLNVQSQTVPFQDGSVFLDALIEQRSLSVTLAMQDNNNLQTRYQQRREVISALNPKLGEGYLIYTNDFISKRIKCIPHLPVFENHNSDVAGTPKASLSWTACEPYWEDLNETVVSTGLNNISYLTINNEGEIPVGFNVTVLGSFPDFIADEKRLKIFSQEENKKIELENSEVIGNLKINTNGGQKSITSRTLFIRQSVSQVFDNPDYAGIKGNIIQKDNYYYAFSKREDSVESKNYQAFFKSSDLINWEQVGTEIEITTENEWKKILYNSFDDKIYILCGFVVNSDQTLVFNSSDNGETWNTQYEQGEYRDFCLDLKNQTIFYTVSYSCIYNPVTEEVAELNGENLINTNGIKIHRGNTVIEKTYTTGLINELQHLFVDSKGNYIIATESISTEFPQRDYYSFYADCNGDEIAHYKMPINYLLETEEGFYIINSNSREGYQTRVLFRTSFFAGSTVEIVQNFLGKVNLAQFQQDYVAYSNFSLLYPMNENNNIINLLTSDSDLNMQIEKGQNHFVIVSDEAINCNITYRQKYIGV